MRSSDRYPRWIAGILYYHPGDPRFLIPIRGGRDHVFNYAKPLATVLTAGSVLLPLVGAALMIGGFLRYFDLVASHLALILLPTSVVLACLGTLLANLFIRDEPTTPIPGAIEPPASERIRNRRGRDST